MRDPLRDRRPRRPRRRGAGAGRVSSSSWVSRRSSGSPPLGAVRKAVEGYELLLAFVVAAIATGGSLFFSEIAHFVPCELCWFQRICMHPLSITTLLAALANHERIARYLLPLPIAGTGVAGYHLLVENGVLANPRPA